MKKFLALLSAVALFGFVGCSDDDETTTGNKDLTIDASSKTTWYYFSMKNRRVIGSGEATEADDAKWFARKDWDFAVKRYNIRTNSGTSTSKGAQGGVYTCDANQTYDALTAVPAGATFAKDEVHSDRGMDGTVVQSRSEAVVAVMKFENGRPVMPPVWLAAPVYIFKSADGKEAYKLKFTNYTNEAGKGGYPQFKLEKLQ